RPAGRGSRAAAGRAVRVAGDVTGRSRGGAGARRGGAQRFPGRGRRSRGPGPAVPPDAGMRPRLLLAVLGLGVLAGGSSSATASPGSGTLISSSSSSDASGSTGEATGGGGALGPAATAAGSHATTEVRATAAGVTASSSIELDNLSLAGGLVKVGKVVGSAT